ncbi:MAG: hypothetical protein Q4F54_04280 [Coriobacteriia bacterium]|nr:hypothetical protein [Coriobacteriia bacterium]
MTYPNKIAEKATVSKEYSKTANIMTKNLIDEFLPLCDIPHPSGHVDEMRQYLLD